MPSITWLHLTDIHLGVNGKRSKWSEVKDFFFTDLQKVTKTSGALDLILFTGDLVYSGSEFAEAADFFTDLFKVIHSTTSARPLLLAVPGNHDLVRPKPSKLVEGHLATLMEWNKISTNIREVFWNRKSSRMRKAATKFFDQYERWWKDQPAGKLATYRHGLLPGDFSVTYEKEGIRLGVTGLNSTFLQFHDGPCDGKLAISREQFHQAHAGRDGAAWAKQHHACLLMTHHPPSWLDPSSKEELDQVHDPDRFFIHLFGHMHKFVSDNRSLAGSAARNTWQGASLFGLDSYVGPDGKESVQRSHGYSIGQLTVTASNKGTMCFWPRMARKLPNNVWRFAPDFSDFEIDEEAYNSTKPVDFNLIQPLILEPANPVAEPLLPLIVATRTAAPEEYAYCAILCIELHASPPRTHGWPDPLADQLIEALNLVKALANERDISPALLKSTPDGVLCIWNLEHDRPDFDKREPILRLAAHLTSELPARLRSRFFQTGTTNVSLGLTHGKTTLAQTDNFVDYLGFPVNLASILKSFAQPEGLVVDPSYFTGLRVQPDVFDLEWKPANATSLSRYVDGCYASKRVISSFDWTCLAWPGVAQTELSKKEEVLAGSPGLNTKGITVVTHEGLQGNIGTLAIWPRHESRSNGDRIELIVDDFDSLTLLESLGSVKLTRHETFELADLHKLGVCPDLDNFERREAAFLFIPIRCGINALVWRSEFSGIFEVERYSDLIPRIKEGKLRPKRIGLYENLGATLPLLILMATSLPKDDAYSATEEQLADMCSILLALTSKEKFQRYSTVSSLSDALHTGRIDLAIGGGAWLGIPGSRDKKITPVVPGSDGGFLWVEGAAITLNKVEDTKHLFNFLVKTLLAESYQTGLATRRPYASSPTVMDVITTALNRNESATGVIDAETRYIFPSPDKLNDLLVHRKCPRHYAAWLSAWNTILKMCCHDRWS